MTLKERLEHIFSNDYPGTEIFLNEVVKPIFGDEIDPIDIDLAEVPQYADRARKSGLKHIKYIGNLTEQNYNADNVVLLDVTVDDSVNIERSRVNIQQLVRSIVQQYQHMLIVFHYENTAGTPWRFSYAYKAGSIAGTTPPKRYTYVFGKDYRGRTAAERFNILANSQRNNSDFEKAFSVEALSDEFFDKYRNIYADFVELITGKRYEKEKGVYVEKFKHEPDPQFASTFDNQDKTVRDYVKKMFGRIVFLYFLQRKGWLYDDDGKSNPSYMHDLFANSTCKDNFLDGCLETFFFRVLNTDKPNRDADALSLPGGCYIPYLNGGLFQEDDIDRLNCVFPAEYFQKLFDFLDSYNFTIDENDREDAEIGIDPEMLGRIFENLLEDNKDKGAFYTPKEIVDYMCRESIIAYLQDDKFSQEGNERIREFIETQNVELLNERQRDYIEDRLIKVKICDPAIGSGAFPMGLVNLLSKLFIALRTYKTIDQAKMKRYIMQNSIYGVDIEKGAVDIARLRFWLAMVVDEVEPMPLPNLNFKIMQGNSLLEYFNGLDLSTLMNREPGRIDFITDAERDQLRRDLNRYYTESNHEVRDKIMHSIKNTVVRMILNADPDSPLSGVDVSENDKFFLWHTWFSDVFDKGGFDIVIGNPPYFVYEGFHKEEVKTLKSLKKYNPAFGGKLNAYKPFLALALNDLSKPDGIVNFIFQNSFLADRQATALRKFVMSNHNILKIDSFPERDNKKKRVFESVKMSVCIVLVKNRKVSPTSLFSVNIWNERDMLTGLFTHFSFDEIQRIDSVDFSIPRLESKYVPLIIKLISKREITLSCFQGELNVSVHKKYFTQQPDQPIILKGAAIQRYFHTLNMSQGVVEYVDEEAYLSKCGNTPKSQHHKLDRIGMQGMTGANDKIRLVSTLIPKGFYMAHSCNYILSDDSYNIHAILSLLNSKCLNWFFRRFSTNSNVNSYEVENLPIPNMEGKIETILSELSKKILDTKTFDSNNDTSELEQEIDHIVYHLYELTYDEVLIVDPETPITREEYENFKID